MGTKRCMLLLSSDRRFGVSSEEAWIQPELCHAGMQQLTG